MRIACWIPKATNTKHTQNMNYYFPLQQWFHGRASMLRHTHISYLVVVSRWHKHFLGFSRQYVAKQVATLKTETINYPQNRRIN